VCRSTRQRRPFRALVDLLQLAALTVLALTYYSGLLIMTDITVEDNYNANLFSAFIAIINGGLLFVVMPVTFIIQLRMLSKSVKKFVGSLPSPRPGQDGSGVGSRMWARSMRGGNQFGPAADPFATADKLPSANNGLSSASAEDVIVKIGRRASSGGNGNGNGSAGAHKPEADLTPPSTPVGAETFAAGRAILIQDDIMCDTDSESDAPSAGDRGSAHGDNGDGSSFGVADNQHNAAPVLLDTEKRRRAPRSR
jgi:hypothetical protein